MVKKVSRQKKTRSNSRKARKSQVSRKRSSATRKRSSATRKRSSAYRKRSSTPKKFRKSVRKSVKKRTVRKKKSSTKRKVSRPKRIARHTSSYSYASPSIQPVASYAVNSPTPDATVPKFDSTSPFITQDVLEYVSPATPEPQATPHPGFMDNFFGTSKQALQCPQPEEMENICYNLYDDPAYKDAMVLAELRSHGSELTREQESKIRKALMKVHPDKIYETHPLSKYKECETSDYCAKMLTR